MEPPALSQRGVDLALALLAPCIFLVNLALFFGSGRILGVGPLFSQPLGIVAIVLAVWSLLA